VIFIFNQFFLFKGEIIMAEIKKYLDTVALGTLVDQIKAEDAKVLAAAKKYADDAGKLYDVAGAAATAESNAKAYTDVLANGQVATNKANIEKLNGDAQTEGSVAKAIADAKALIDADVDAVEKKADDNAAAIAAINNAENGILAQAKAHADGEVAKVQGEVDTLETYVGTFTHDTAKTVVEYINAKTDGIATSGNLEALGARVTAVEGDVATIKGDYLKASDKTELEGKITAANTAVETEKSRAEGIEAGLRTDINTVMGDYLKAADKTELQGNIDTVAGAVERLTNGVSADEIDGVNDLIQYVKDHGTEVTGMQKDISDNAGAIAGVAGRMDTAEGKITAVEGAVATKAEKTYVDEQVQALQGVDTGLDNRLKAVEAAVGESGSVADDIATAKQEAIDAAAADATSKANAAEAAAKGHADSLNTAMNTRVEALEAIDHDHANKAELDLIASGDKAKWDAAAGKAHEHGNKDVIDGITAAKVSAWDAAEGNAKTYADGLNTAMTTKVDGVDNRVKALEEAAPSYALDADLDAAVERIAANEAAIAANTSAINSFTAITSEEVIALFA
jgi:hypothetical protein